MDYLRAYLRGIGVGDDIVKHATDTSVYMEKHRLGLISLSKSKLDWIDRFSSIDSIVGRVKGYLTIDPFPCTAESYADFLVAFSARSSEGLSLYSTEGGKLKGAIKQVRRDVVEEYEIASCLDDSLALQFLRTWEKIPMEKRVEAQIALKRIVKSWGIRIKDIRVYGSELAVRRRQLEGPITQLEAKKTKIKALRHKYRCGITDHYMSTTYNPELTGSKSPKIDDDTKAKAIRELDQLLDSIAI